MEQQHRPIKKEKLDQFTENNEIFPHKEENDSPFAKISERVGVALPSIRPWNLYGDLGKTQVAIDRKDGLSVHDVAPKDEITQPAFMDTLSKQIEKEARLRAIVKRVQMSKELAHP